MTDSQQITNGFIVLGIGWGVFIVVMATLWAVQRRTRDASVVDVAWSIGVAGLIATLAFVGTGDPWRRALVGAMGGVWGLRLAAHLFFDRGGKRGEDSRYRRMRDHLGDRADFGFFWFFQAQALFVPIFALPVLPTVFNPRPAPSVTELIALAIFAISIGGETLADRQLSRFRHDPANKGKTCREGLWRYSRHPNYFFEWVHWWAYVPLAWGAPVAWLSLLGPVVMLVFLYRVTGIPYTEAQALESRGDDYRRYQETTSAFFPWFPRKDTT